MDVPESEGKCFFCDKYIAKRAISRHLATHLSKAEAKIEEEDSVKTFLHLQVQAGPFFLNLLINEKAKLKSLDSFLRKIWLECCGHLSVFRNSTYEIGMKINILDAFIFEDKLNYEYDFGSTTQSTIKAYDSYDLNYKEAIVLLSRNEPLKIMCSNCEKKPASQMCSECSYNYEAFFCNSCAKKHAKECEDFEDYASMPLVNSPRFGVCAYEGGTIDKERDGGYVERKV